jgi:ribosomal protein S18 acetylase RimI-like enzyme
MADMRAFKASFVGVYQAIISEPPYYQRLFPMEAQAVLKRTLETSGHSSFFLVMGATQVLGFGLGVPLESRSEICKEVRGLLDVSHTFYLSEFGVLPKYRERGLGRLMLESRLAEIDRAIFSHAIVRTSTADVVSKRLYKKLGFEEVGVFQEVMGRRNDGTVRSDRRMFMAKVL